MEKKMTARGTAKSLAQILTDFLSTLPPEERKKRIEAGQGVLKSNDFNRFSSSVEFGGYAAELRRGEKDCGGYANLGLRSLARSSLPCPRLLHFAAPRLAHWCDPFFLRFTPQVRHEPNRYPH